jgi:hypothetical protein
MLTVKSMSFLVRPLSLLLLLVSLIAFSVSHPSSAKSAVSHVVISEVQIEGNTDVDDEFVELYNPTGTPVIMSGWRLAKKTASGTQTDLVTTLNGTIPAQGFFLIAHTDYDGSVTENVTYSTNIIAANNTIVLYSDAGTTVVDKVGFGSGASLDSETSPFATNPNDDESLERKASNTSTADSMTTGSDVSLGNAEDTDNNANDFILRAASDPQNATSAIEPLVITSPSPTATSTPTGSPTSSPTPTVTASPTVTPTSSPSATPTVTASPTATATTTPSPTSSPTMSASPTPTVTATASSTPTSVPTITPTSSPTSSPTASPSVSPSGSPTATTTSTPRPVQQFSCRFEFVNLSFGFFSLKLPMFTCSFR